MFTNIYSEQNGISKNQCLIATRKLFQFQYRYNKRFIFLFLSSPLKSKTLAPT